MPVLNVRSLQAKTQTVSVYTRHTSDCSKKDDVPLVALLAKRTFWEKVTILHAEFHRPADKDLPDRYSRHYYDVVMLARGPIRAEALSDMDLLDQVVRHKQTFYPSAWAHYAVAHPGSLRLFACAGADGSFGPGLQECRDFQRNAAIF